MKKCPLNQISPSSFDRWGILSPKQRIVELLILVESFFCSIYRIRHNKSSSYLELQKQRLKTSQREKAREGNYRLYFCLQIYRSRAPHCSLSEPTQVTLDACASKFPAVYGSNMNCHVVMTTICPQYPTILLQ